MMNIRAANVEDIPLILQLECASATAAHWSEEQYRRAIEKADETPKRLMLVAESAGTGGQGYQVEISTMPLQKPTLSLQKTEEQGWGTPRKSGVKIPGQTQIGPVILIGFLVARNVAPEWELENVVVRAEFRGAGIGTQLLEALLTRARAINSRSIFLEVRESNTAARRLYAKAGFRETGRRKGYYSDPPEDAILYFHDVLC